MQRMLGVEFHFVNMVIMAHYEIRGATAPSMEIIFSVGLLFYACGLITIGDKTNS